jgi:hypothetical protein
VILRRAGWSSGPELEAAAARSTQVGDEDMPDDIRWIRSYVLDEGDGKLGTVCIYEATSPEAIRKHAERAAAASSSGPELQPARRRITYCSILCLHVSLNAGTTYLAEVRTTSAFLPIFRGRSTRVRGSERPRRLIRTACGSRRSSIGLPPVWRRRAPRRA